MAEKTLALNVIVGCNEAYELNRCLSSAKKTGIFDEIVVTLTSGDENVKNVAQKYATKISYFEWIKDFAAARNHCLENTESDYVFWIDADDVIPDNVINNFKNIKQIINKNNYNFYLIPYHIDYVDEGKFLQLIPRDRIFKNNKKIKWEYRVHEQLMHDKNDKSIPLLKGVYIEHRPIRPGSGLIRNVEILKEEHEKDSSNSHYAFYYARDNFLLNNYDISIPIFDYIIEHRLGCTSTLYSSALCIAQYFTYDNDGGIKSETIDLGENYARIAMSFEIGSDGMCKYAEPYCILGDISYYRGKISDAEKLYRTAMRRKLDAKGVQQIIFYEEIPAERLSKIYFNNMSYQCCNEQALYYNALALKNNPYNEEYHNFRKKIIEEITK